MLENYITKKTPVTTIHNLKLTNPEQLAKKLNIDKHTLDIKNNWFLLNDQWYYFKKDNPRLNGSLNELIGQYITQHFGLKPVTHQIAKLKDDQPFTITSYGLLSKNFRDPNKIYHVLKPIEKGQPITYFNYIQQYGELANDLKRLVIRDLYASETDRQFTNVLFEQAKDSHEIRLAPIFDNELSLNVVRNRYVNFLFSIDLKDPSVGAYMKQDPLFQELLDQVQTFPMKKVLKKMEDTYHLKLPKINRDDLIHYDREQKRNIRKKTR